MRCQVREALLGDFDHHFIELPVANWNACGDQALELGTGIATGNNQIWYFIRLGCPFELWSVALGRTSQR